MLALLPIFVRITSQIVKIVVSSFAAILAVADRLLEVDDGGYLCEHNYQLLNEYNTEI
jgi:hypothetical protein